GSQPGERGDARRRGGPRNRVRLKGGTPPVFRPAWPVQAFCGRLGLEKASWEPGGVSDMVDAVARVDSRTSAERSHTSRWVRLFMCVTQVVRDSTVVEPAKVAAQQERRLDTIQVLVSAYDQPDAKITPRIRHMNKAIQEKERHQHLKDQRHTDGGIPTVEFITGRKPHRRKQYENEDQAAKAKEKRST